MRSLDVQCREMDMDHILFSTSILETKYAGQNTRKQYENRTITVRSMQYVSVHAKYLTEKNTLIIYRHVPCYYDGSYGVILM